jgi:probable phosphoglycerate mutase
MRLYLIRHGDPDYQTDSLTEQGKSEAEALADFLAPLGIDFLYTSPLGRAFETASIVGRRIGIMPIVQEWTRELEPHKLPGSNLVYWNISGHDVRTTEYLANPANWDEIPQLACIPCRTVFDRIEENSDRFLTNHGYVREGGSYRVAEANEHSIAICCHGGFGVTWLAHLLAIPPPLAWAGFFIRTSSITTILFEERPDGWATPRCIGLDELSHLHLRGLNPGTSGFVANTR